MNMCTTLFCDPHSLVSTSPGVYSKSILLMFSLSLCSDVLKRECIFVLEGFILSCSSKAFHSDVLVWGTISLSEIASASKLSPDDWAAILLRLRASVFEVWKLPGEVADRVVSAELLVISSSFSCCGSRSGRAVCTPLSPWVSGARDTAPLLHSCAIVCCGCVCSAARGRDSCCDSPDTEMFDFFPPFPTIPPRLFFEGDVFNIGLLKTVLHINFWKRSA